jgi:flagellar motor switch protein FliN/FliY
MSDELLGEEGLREEGAEGDEKELAEQARILKNLSRTVLDVDVVLVDKEYQIGDLMALSPGSVLTFEKNIEDSASLSVNGKKFAHGEIVQVNEMYGLRIAKMSNG